MTTIVSHSMTEQRSTPIRITAEKHELIADFSVEGGGEDAGPRPHDFFDASLVACKSMTASWYANKFGYPLTGVDVEVTRDDSKERHGEYKLLVKMRFHGELTDEQREKLHAAVVHCPIQRLMTQVKITVEDAR
jgi:putative redox protein